MFFLTSLWNMSPRSPIWSWWSELWILWPSWCPLPCPLPSPRAQYTPNDGWSARAFSVSAHRASTSAGKSQSSVLTRWEGAPRGQREEGMSPFAISLHSSNLSITRHDEGRTVSRRRLYFEPRSVLLSESGLESHYSNWEFSFINTCMK